MIKHTLYIGLNDKDTKQQEISTLDAFKIVLNSVKSCYDGATVKECKGFYTHSDGSITIENSFEVSILFADEVKTRSVIEMLKTMLNQESIALQREEVTSELI